MTVKAYLLSLPERLVRSVLGLGAGVAREVGEVAVPASIRRGQLYQNLVDATLRFLIEQVGGAEGVYKAGDKLPDDFLVRRTAGNAVEALGIVAFRASPVWVLAALADVCGMGRHLIPEIADALKAQGLLEQDAQFTSVEQMLDGLERTSSRLASTINTPPLDVAALREEWQAIREDARGLQPGTPAVPRDDRRGLGTAEERRGAAGPVGLRNLVDAGGLRGAQGFPTACAGSRHRRWWARRAPASVFAETLLDHYKQTLDEMQQVGFASYAARQFRPYVRAAAGQFSPARRTLTQRLLERLARRASGRGYLEDVVRAKVPRSRLSASR